MRELSNRDRKILRRASVMAELSTCNQRHAAVVIKGGRTLGVGINTTRNDPNIVDNPKVDAATHAEVAAVRACGDPTNLRGATIYVARAGRNGKSMMSKPCPLCQDFLDNLGIKKVVYTLDMMDLNA